MFLHVSVSHSAHRGACMPRTPPTSHYACPLPSCHTCPPPLPCTPPGHVCPPTTHTPLPCLPPRHTCLPPLPCIPPGPHMPPPPVTHAPLPCIPPRHYDMRSNERAVRILLECILVSSKNTHSSQNRFHCRPKYFNFFIPIQQSTVCKI